MSEDNYDHDHEDYDSDHDEYDHDDYDDYDCDFADPGGNSALRAETPTNPRNLPCPQCKQQNVLTPKDIALHYICDDCADRAEGHGY